LRLKRAVRDVTGGLAVSVGISGTKYVAKVASGHGKPDGLTIVPPADAAAWLAPQPVSNLWGAGPKTTARLEQLGLHTIGAIAQLDPTQLEGELGALGRRFLELARGLDPRGVSGERAARGLSSERTLEKDISGRAAIEPYLRSAAETVARRLRRRRERACGVRIKLKRADFQIVTRQRALPKPTDVSTDLYAAGAALLGSLDLRGPFRLVGLGAYDLDSPVDQSQLALPIVDGRTRRLETTIDGLRERFGTCAVQRASELLEDRGVGLAANLDFLDS
jgi:DNA polymerase-4